MADDVSRGPARPAAIGVPYVEACVEGTKVPGTVVGNVDRVGLHSRGTIFFCRRYLVQYISSVGGSRPE